MTADSVFWIASMTKAITTAAGMQLVEQGKLSLDEPIGKLLPDLASPQVLEGFDASGEPKLRAGQEADHAAPSHDPHRRLRLRHVERRHARNIWRRPAPRHHHLPERRAEDADHDRSRHALGIRHQYRFRRQGGGSRERQAARRLPARPYVRAARHERHRLQDHGLPAPAAGRHACARRGRIAGADPVRAGTESGIPHGRRRPLRHGGRLHQVHPDDPQQGPRQRQPAA